MLQKLKTEEDIEIFAKYKVDLIKLHQEYAKKLGLFDNKVDTYNKDDAIKHLNAKNYYQFLIREDNKDIGILEYKITKSDIDNSKILYINVLYIIEEHRKSGIGKKIMVLAQKLWNDYLVLDISNSFKKKYSSSG